MLTRHTFLLISRRKEQWHRVLQQGLSSLGKLHIAPEEEAIQMVVQNKYDMVIIDAGGNKDAFFLTTQVRTERPEMRIVFVTASPIWQLARRAFLAGAADYATESLDQEELQTKIQEVLEAPVPSWTR